MPMDNPIITMACLHFNPHPLTMPTAMSTHFHGSVSQTKRGIQDASIVTPDEKAYTAKNLVKGTRLPPLVMAMTKNPVHAEIKVIETAFISNMPAMMNRLSRKQVRLAPVKNKLDKIKKQKGC